jgi:hypothetical protein
VKGEEDANQRGKENQREYLSEVFNFSCVLRGDVKYLEKIKEHIITEYVDTGLIKLIRPTYDKKEIYLLTDEEWDEYQKLKKKDSRLIGAGFP